MKIARGLSLSRGAVIRTLNRFQASQIPWPLPESMTSEALENALYKAPETCSDDFTSVPTPELYSAAHQELIQSKHLTLKLLHQEWTQAGRTQVSYSRFCHHYRHYKKSLGRSFTNTYAGGEYSFIDFSGDSFGLTPKGGGDKIKTELFVWCFGASNMTYWEFCESQKQSDLLPAMEHGMDYFQCVSKVCVVDNMKTAVTRACRYEPQLNAVFSEFATHHGFCAQKGP